MLIWAHRLLLAPLTMLTLACAGHLLALRAIGNAGRTNTVSILSQCARETDNDMDTRVAAIQAFRRMPCGTDVS